MNHLHRVDSVLYKDCTRAYSGVTANSESSTTTTITVYTRHSSACPKHEDPRWRNCKCRKYLYVYGDGVARRVSAKTRVWGTADRRRNQPA